MTSFQWNFDSAQPFCGAGIDAESPSRFVSALCEDHPFPFIFTKDEISFAKGSAEPAFSLCAAFCCKEALFKATGIPYNFTECELIELPKHKSVSLRLGKELREEAGISSAIAHISRTETEPSEVVAVVLTFRADGDK